MASSKTVVDALVVGAGFGGIYSTHRLLRMGLQVRCIDIAGDVGGTWYWNRYPGAMSDTESYLYRYSWDAEDLRTYPWTHHYLYQPEILKYLQHIVTKHDLRKHMQFNCAMKEAAWDNELRRWRVTCSTGDVVVARYLVNSLGLLSKPKYPPIQGLEKYEGRLVHTATWDESISLKGKRVGVIGNGSTGVQVMTAIASQVSQLTSFQRHPQYSVPSGQGEVSLEYRKKINETYDPIYKKVWASNVAFGVPESTRKTMSATPEERRQAFEEVWKLGNGFRFMFSAFGDIITDLEANKAACNFIQGKISDIVKDSRKAAILKPKELYARRPLCDSGYYEIFNLEHVDVVDIKEAPIQEMTSKGVKLENGVVHELDVLIFATGFESFDGGYEKVHITGRNGGTLQNHWRCGPTAYGSIACSGFPNMFIISGPQGPFANFIPVIESEIEFAMECILFAENHDVMSNNGTHLNGYHENDTEKQRRPVIMEVTPEAEHGWVQLCSELADGSIFKSAPSWIFAENIEGGKPSTNFYFGGLAAYRKWVSDEVSGRFPGFRRY